eukprot:Platyproteum_vivax@DN2490_c0_g1_i2.p1
MYSALIPLLLFLKDTPKEWVSDLLDAFKEGKLDLYDAAMTKHRQAFDTSELKPHETMLRKKITLLAFMELSFGKSKKDRKLTFREIARHCKIGENEVEFLVMKAMANKLVEGRIDEVDKTVRVTWVKPRILDSTRLAVMKERFIHFSSGAKELLTHLEELTPELLVS